MKVHVQFTAKAPKVDVSASFDADTDNPKTALELAATWARQTVKVWRALRGIELTFKGSIED